LPARSDQAASRMGATWSHPMEGALITSVSSTKEEVQMEMSLFTRSAGSGRAGKAAQHMGQGGAGDKDRGVGGWVGG
jgi:hypothetical protein